MSALADFQTAPLRFSKYQALGNSYLVVPAESSLTADQIRLVCDARYGIGSDGVLIGPSPSISADFAVRIFNPDGSEAEKSGNGLRIFCRSLWDAGRVGEDEFSIETRGGVVRARVSENGARVSVGMGRVSFDSRRIPVAGPEREVLLEPLQIDGEALRFSAATIGNPHCVIRVEEASETQARRLGPLIEKHATFPNRTNVQFVQVLDRHNIRLEIWERGAGYTHASGSSSCAAAAVAHRLGWCEATITSHMRGGTLDISIDPAYSVHMAGPVVRICSGTIDRMALNDVIGAP